MEAWPSEWNHRLCSIAYACTISVNVYYYIGHEELASPITSTEAIESWPPERLAEWSRQAKEFRIGSMGFADSFGILLASLIAMPTEVNLCRLQVERGRDLCTQIR